MRKHSGLLIACLFGQSLFGHCNDKDMIEYVLYYSNKERKLDYSFNGYLVEYFAKTEWKRNYCKMLSGTKYIYEGEEDFSERFRTMITPSMLLEYHSGSPDMPGEVYKSYHNWTRDDFEDYRVSDVLPQAARVSAEAGKYFHDIIYSERYEHNPSGFGFDRSHTSYSRFSLTDVRLFPGLPRLNSTNKLVKVNYDIDQLKYVTNYNDEFFELWRVVDIDEGVLFDVDNQLGKGFRHEVVLSIPNYLHQHEESFPSLLHPDLSPNSKLGNSSRYSKNIDLIYSLEVIPPKVVTKECVGK
ncbi:MAG: hypothetical protein H8E20_03300 [Verrucomicrobia bacterium]|nr:hypothetical protein [Verrucomicrobiota bacterium]